MDGHGATRGAEIPPTIAKPTNSIPAATRKKEGVPRERPRDHHADLTLPSSLPSLTNPPPPPQHPQDAHATVLGLDEDTSFFGVYDGHGGKEVRPSPAPHSSNPNPTRIRRTGFGKASSTFATFFAPFFDNRGGPVFSPDVSPDQERYSRPDFVGRRVSHHTQPLLHKRTAHETGRGTATDH